MKIIVSQKDKKILIEFRQGKVVDPSTSLRINKAEDFLLAIDKFFRKRKIRQIGRIGLIGPMSLLTERIIRAIVAGLRF